jgi:hypothetical protein
MRRPRRASALLPAVFVALAAAAPHAAGQGFGGTTVRDSHVGYIDPAIPGDLFRFRFDASYDDNRPTRAEFFWPRTGPGQPGPPLPERRVDYQDFSADLEVAAGPNLSGFVEVPVRLLNPEVNANADGLADVNAGLKVAVVRRDDLVATLQLRTYAPTGDARHGIGTGHVSLEPAFLLWRRLDDRLTFEGELRYWAPVGGTDFAGDVMRYGVGLSYEALRNERLTVVPVAELVGWTVLGGKESMLEPSGVAAVKSAAGDTIVNVKLGARFQLNGWGDLYAGYGRPLTGDVWYKNTLRVEWRLLF